MLRSFHYASHAVIGGPKRDPLLTTASSEDIVRWLSIWYVWIAASFLKAYLGEAAGGGYLAEDPKELATLLNAYLLEKAVYELSYELNIRPDWVRIPLEGIRQLLETS